MTAVSDENGLATLEQNPLRKILSCASLLHLPVSTVWQI